MVNLPSIGNTAMVLLHCVPVLDLHWLVLIRRPLLMATALNNRRFRGMNVTFPWTCRPGVVPATLLLLKLFLVFVA